MALDEIAVADDEFFHALDEHVEAEIDVVGGVGEFVPDGIGDVVAEQDTDAATVSEVGKDFEPCDAASPADEIAVGPEGVVFFPEDRGGLLHNLVGVVAAADLASDEGIEPPLTGGQTLDKLASGFFVHVESLREEERPNDAHSI